MATKQTDIRTLRAKLPVIRNSEIRVLSFEQEFPQAADDIQVTQPDPNAQNC